MYAALSTWVQTLVRVEKERDSLKISASELFGNFMALLLSSSVLLTL
jgi:hypothetical protein